MIVYVAMSMLSTKFECATRYRTAEFVVGDYGKRTYLRMPS